MKFDYLIVGTGQAGVPLATKLVQKGRRVAIFEKSHLGGTCVNTGCTPTKTMIASARAAHVARTAPRLGVHASQVEVDFPAVVERKRALVTRWRSRVSDRLASAGDRLKLIRGQARFESAHTVIVNGDRFTGDRVIVNVGCRPSQPGIRGLETVSWLDNDRAMELESLPPHLVVIGGGYIGCELGQMFRRFGADVTILDHNEHLLSREDEPVSSAIEEAFRSEGITVRLGVKVSEIRPGAGSAISVVLADGSSMEGSHLLVAAGRSPNTEDLGCESAGIELDDRGFITVDARYRTTADDVYAVGDVTGGPQFTHSSWDDHRILLGLLEEGSSRTRDDRLVPYAVFTDPSVGRVGLTERAAREQGIPYEIATLPFAEVARAIEIDETAGLFQVLIDPKSDRILGAAIVGVEAAELIHVFAAMMASGASAESLVRAEMIHPTLAEGLQSVLMTLSRYS